VDGREFQLYWSFTIWKRVTENRHELAEAAQSSHILTEQLKRWKRN